MGSFLVRASAPIAATPLPAALPLFASALAGLGAVAHRRRKSACWTTAEPAIRFGDGHPWDGGRPAPRATRRL